MLTILSTVGKCFASVFCSQMYFFKHNKIDHLWFCVWNWQEKYLLSFCCLRKIAQAEYVYVNFFTYVYAYACDILWHYAMKLRKIIFTTQAIAYPRFPPSIDFPCAKRSQSNTILKFSRFVKPIPSEYSKVFLIP